MMLSLQLIEIDFFSLFNLISGHLTGLNVSVVFTTSLELYFLIWQIGCTEHLEGSIIKMLRNSCINNLIWHIGRMFLAKI